MNYGALELELGFAISEMASPNLLVGMALIAPLSFQARLDALTTLVGIYVPNPEVLKELAEIIVEVSKCQKDRNLFLHSAWIDQHGVDKDKLKARYKLSRTAAIQPVPMKPAEIMDRAIAVDAVRRKLMAFVNSLEIVHPPGITQSRRVAHVEYKTGLQITPQNATAKSAVPQIYIVPPGSLLEPNIKVTPHDQTQSHGTRCTPSSLRNGS